MKIKNLLFVLAILSLLCVHTFAATEVKEEVKKAAAQAKDKAQEVKAQAQDKAQEIKAQAQDKAQEVKAQAQDKAQDIKEAATANLKAAVDAAEKTANAAGSKIGEAVDAAKDAASGAAEKIKEVAGKAADKAAEIKEEAVKKGAQAAKEAGKKAETAKGAAKEASKKAEKKAGQAAEKAKAQASDTLDEAKKMAAEYSEKAQEIFDEYSTAALKATEEYREQLAKSSTKYATHLADTYLDADHAKVLKTKYFNWYGVGVAGGVFLAVFIVARSFRWILGLYTLRAFVVTFMLGVYGTLLVLTHLSVDPSIAVSVSSRSALRLWNTAAVAAAATVVAVNFLSIFKGSFRNIFLFVISVGLFFEQLGLRDDIEQAVGPIPKYSAYVLIYLLLTIFSYGPLVPSRSFVHHTVQHTTTTVQPAEASKKDKKKAK